MQQPGCRSGVRAAARDRPAPREDGAPSGRTARGGCVCARCERQTAEPEACARREGRTAQPAGPSRARCEGAAGWSEPRRNTQPERAVRPWGWLSRAGRGGPEPCARRSGGGRAAGSPLWAADGGGGAPGGGGWLDVLLVLLVSREGGAATVDRATCASGSRR